MRGSWPPSRAISRSSGSDAAIIEEAVYNYTHDLSYIWGEISVPVRCGDDREQAEAIILGATQRHALDANTIGEEVACSLEWRLDLRPHFLSRTGSERGHASA